MYGVAPNVKLRGPTEIENAVACPTCKAIKGEACSIAHFPHMGESTEIPHNKRALAAAKASS